MQSLRAQRVHQLVNDYTWTLAIRYRGSDYASKAASICDLAVTNAQQSVNSAQAGFETAKSNMGGIFKTKRITLEVGKKHEEAQLAANQESMIQEARDILRRTGEPFVEEAEELPETQETSLPSPQMQGRRQWHEYHTYNQAPDQPKPTPKFTQEVFERFLDDFHPKFN